jgi:hypothetical protein
MSRIKNFGALGVRGVEREREMFYRPFNNWSVWLFMTGMSRIEDFGNDGL